MFLCICRQPRQPAPAPEDPGPEASTASDSRHEHGAKSGPLPQTSQAQQDAAPPEHAWQQQTLWQMLQHKLQASYGAAINSSKHLRASWALYLAQPCCPAALAIALLYLTVLSLGILMTGAPSPLRASQYWPCAAS